MPARSRVTRAEFEQMAALRPSLVHGRYVTVIFAPLLGLASAKVACVVSKKVSAKAVERNKVQRRLREIVRPLVTTAAQPVVIVIRAKKEALSADMAHLRSDLAPLLQRALSL